MFRCCSPTPSPSEMIIDLYVVHKALFRMSVPGEQGGACTWDWKAEVSLGFGLWWGGSSLVLGRHLEDLFCSSHSDKH